MAPLMYLLRSGVFRIDSRYARRFSTVFAMLYCLKRLAIVGPLSSMAIRPLPFATIALAVACSSAMFMGSGPPKARRRSRKVGRRGILYLCAEARHVSRKFRFNALKDNI